MSTPLESDRRAAALAACLGAIDRAVKRYHQKLAGLEPWTTFEVPARLASGVGDSLEGSAGGPDEREGRR